MTVDDDTPIRTGAISSGTVDEDGVFEGAADAGPGDGIAGGPGDFVDPNTDGDNDETTVTGTIAGLPQFQSGADEPLTFSLTTDTTALEAQNLTSGGVALTYAVAGNVLTASAGVGNTVFTFTLNPERGVDVHSGWTSSTMRRATAENDLTIFLGSLIQATDFDGDTAPGGAVQIVVNDDTPIATATGRRPGRLTRTALWKARRTLARATALPAGAGDVAGAGHGCDRLGGGAVPVRRGRAADLWVHSQCGCDVAGAGSDVGRRCADLRDCCEHGDGVCDGRQHGVHVHAGPATGDVDLHAG